MLGKKSTDKKIENLERAVDILVKGYDRMREAVEFNANGISKKDAQARFFPSTYYEDDYKTAEEKHVEWLKMRPEQKKKFEFIKYADPARWDGQNGYFTWEEGMNKAAEVGLRWDGKKFVDI